MILYPFATAVEFERNKILNKNESLYADNLNKLTDFETSFAPMKIDNKHNKQMGFEKETNDTSLISSLPTPCTDLVTCRYNANQSEFVLLCGDNATFGCYNPQKDHLKGNRTENILFDASSMNELYVTPMQDLALLFTETLRKDKGYNNLSYAIQIWERLCVAKETLNLIFVGAGLFSLLWVSIDRYIYIHYPYYYIQKVTIPRSILAAVLTWFLIVCATGNNISLDLFSSFINNLK